MRQAYKKKNTCLKTEILLTIIPHPLNIRLTENPRETKDKRLFGKILPSFFGKNKIILKKVWKYTK